MEGTSPGKTAGKWMFIFAWAALLFVLALVFGNWEDKKYNPNQSLKQNEQGEIVLIRNKYNHYVLNGLINGEDVVFFLDTGATSVSVPQKLAEQLKLKPRGKYIVNTANGQVEVRGTTIDKLEIANITLYNIRASINPGFDSDEILLGMSALKDLEFTQSGNQLTLRKVK